MLADDQALFARIDMKGVRRREARRRRRSLLVGLAFMSPAILLVVVVLLGPVVYNVFLSFTKWKKFKGLDEWGGFSNYTDLIGHPYFTEAFWNTSIWVAASLVFPIALGLGLALLLRGIPGENIFKNIIFIPRVLAPTAVGVIWFYVYSPDGLLNSLIAWVTGEPPDVGWLYQSNTITPAIIVTHVWQGVGLIMVLLLLGLAAIPKDPLEAAKMDGATPRQVFWHIILPLLTPTLVVVSILSVLAGFSAFDLLYVMGVSYPGQRTLSLAVYLYFEAFMKGSWAFSAAIAVVIGLVAVSVTWVQALLQARAERMTH